MAINRTNAAGVCKASKWETGTTLTDSRFTTWLVCTQNRQKKKSRAKPHTALRSER